MQQGQIVDGIGCHDRHPVLTQSIAILEYLNEKFPQANLLGNTIEQRFEARRWLAINS
ncbi:hypothetical protein QWA_17790 [Alcaligenes faecalis subsp. faecalis NCIB 8687]|nr:hypothetical protein QWA_17790 [Alcaligenes faecalis subsp. faecalis NCIB 8687]